MSLFKHKEWQPIRTAPKDGTPILTWDGTQCAVVIWCGCQQEWRLLDSSDCLTEWIDITHWMSLPAPPN